MNHSRVDIRDTSISCGITQISRISDEIDDVLFAIGTKFYHAAHGQPPAFVIWSNLADQETNGHRLAKRLGELGISDNIQQTNAADNPHTGAIICMWSWQVKHEAFKEWYKNKKVDKLKDQYPKKD